MYSRDYEDVTVEFEASGGLINSSLVMQDRQTDTYWSMMKGEAIAGELEGNDLVELPVSEKMQWRDWKAKHADTLVLSVRGREDTRSSYRSYFADPKGGDVPATVEFGRVAAAPVNTLRQQPHRCQEISVCF